MIVFTCNHCPYALAWHDRIARRRSRLRRPRRALPRDQLERRRPLSARLLRGDAGARRARRTGRCPYLHDESQDVARDYGAKTTPDVFVVDADGHLRYRGAPDADYSDPAENAAWLRGALDAVLDGPRPRPGRDRAGRLQHQVEAVGGMPSPTARDRTQNDKGRGRIKPAAGVKSGMPTRICWDMSSQVEWVGRRRTRSPTRAGWRRRRAPRPSAPRARSGPARCGARRGSPRPVSSRGTGGRCSRA